MESLNPGVLLLLLQGKYNDKDKDPSSSPVGASPRRRLLHGPPAVLQITGIVPAVAGPDLSPDKGFYVKLSDASHSTLVSLPADLNDLILADRLQIGQLIHVRRLEPASPVPVLRDFRLLTGRHPCHHDTVDLASSFANPTRPPHSPSNPSVSFRLPHSPYSPSGSFRQPHSLYSHSGSFRASRSPSATNNSGSFRPSGTPPRPPPEKKRLTHSRSCSAVFGGSDSPSSFAATPVRRAVKKREVVGKRRNSDVLSDLKNFNFASMAEENSDSDESRLYFSTSSSSSSSSPFTVRSRKSWDSPGRNIREKRKETNPVAGLQRSVPASPNRLPDLFHPMSKDYASCRQNSMEKPPRLQDSVKRKLSDSEKSCSEVTSISSSCSSADSIKCPDKVSAVWALLPSNLMKQGKEALKQRDSAVQAATDSLLEAAAAENFIECLSTYAELQAEKDNDPQDVIDRFLNFHRQLGQTKLIAQSLSKAAQQSPCAASGRSVAKVALERKNHAALWIKAALESELSQLPTQLNTKAARASEEITLEAIAASAGMPSSMASKPKNALPKGSGLLMAANALQYEFNRWFLRYIERFLDTLRNGARYGGAYEMEVPALLCWLKRVDDWLNSIASKDLSWPRERAREAVLGLEDEEMVACERVRRKIYSVLLRHVESAASALESMSTPDPEKNMEFMLAR